MNDQLSNAPPTLLQKSTILRSKIDQLRARSGNEQILRTWRSIEEALPKHRERLETLAGSLRVLRKHKVVPTSQSITPQTLSSILDKLEKVRSRLESKPGKVMEGNAWANCDTMLTAEENGLEARLKSTWAGYIALLIPAVEHLKPFMNLGRCGADVQKITRLQDELTALQFSLPINESVLRDAQSKSEEIKTIISSLDLGDVPEVVKLFIEKVNSLRGATLEDAKGAVFAWLEEKKLLGAFRIK